MNFLPPLRLAGALALTKGRLTETPVTIAAGRIVEAAADVVDLQGFLILPGAVDLCGPAMPTARACATRPDPAGRQGQRGRRATPEQAAEHAAEHVAETPETIGGALAAAGVTTALLRQEWGWLAPEDAAAAARHALGRLAAAASAPGADLKLRIDCETHAPESGAALAELARAPGLAAVMFRNSLSRHAELLRDDPAGFARRARALGVEPDTLATAVEAAVARSAAVPRHLCRLAEAFDQAGLPYGSHGDVDGEDRARFAMFGARLAEFPATRRAAAAAHALGNPLILDAAAILPGADDMLPDEPPHQARAAARPAALPAARPAALPAARPTAIEAPRAALGPACTTGLVAAGMARALASGGTVGTLAAAAWHLVDRGILDLPRAWALISSAPAMIAGLHDRGAIMPGLRADLVIVHAESRRVEATIAGGRLCHAEGEAACRFRHRSRLLGLAAE